MSLGPWYLILTLVNNLALMSLFCLPTHLEEEKELLDSKQPGNSELLRLPKSLLTQGSAKNFINTGLDSTIFFCQKITSKGLKPHYCQF